MFSWSQVPRALLVLSALPVLSAAQTGGCPGRSFSAKAAVAQSDRADASIAPGQFQGRGPSATIAGDIPIHGVCTTISVSGATSSLTSLSGTLGHERLIDGVADIEALAPIVSLTPRATLAIGLAAQTSLGVTTHTFADAQQTTSSFRLGVLSLGPAVRAWYATPQFRFSAGLALGAASLVDHSYNQIFAGDLAPSLHFAWWNTLRSASGSIEIERSLTPGLALGVGYRAYGVRYDDARQVRTLSQSLSLGVKLTARPERR